MPLVWPRHRGRHLVCVLVLSLLQISCTHPFPFLGADTGMYLVYLTTFSYLADSYSLCAFSLLLRSFFRLLPARIAFNDQEKNSADASSALSAMSFVRNLVGAIFVG